MWDRTSVLLLELGLGAVAFMLGANVARYRSLLVRGALVFAFAVTMAAFYSALRWRAHAEPRSHVVTPYNKEPPSDQGGNGGAE